MIVLFTPKAHRTQTEGVPYQNRLTKQTAKGINTSLIYESSFAVHPTTNHHQQDTNRQLPKPLLSTEDGIHS